MTDHKIWDPFVRAFHWSVAAGFLGNALLAEDDSKLHEWVGYAVLILLGLRILWGIIGPKSARFSSFWPTSTGVTEQLSDLATHRRKAHVGHTPLGALMIFNLLFSLLAIGLSGWMMTTNTFWGVDWVEETHEALVIWAEISVVLHVAAVIWESWRTGVNLPQAMITGTKRVPDNVKLVP